MPSEKIAGTIYLSIDGQRTDLSGDVSYEVPGEEAESMVGPDATLNFKATPKEGMIEAEMPAKRQLMTVTYPNMVANNGRISLRVELANGVILSMPDAYLMTTLKSTGNEGKVTLKWCSMNLAAI